MTARANPTLIGAFIVGALVLLVGGVFLFGSGRLFQDNMDAVLYFDGDVQGLNVGAAVKFRGVRVGEVTSISTVVEPGSTEVRIPVTINVVGTRQLARQMAGNTRMNPFEFMIQEGLRGQLRTESLVTGLLFVQLDFYPDAPVDDLPLVDPATGLHRIPTVPTMLQEAQVTMRGLVEKLEKLPLADMLESLHGVLEGADKLLNAPGIQEAPARIETTLSELQSATRETNARLGPLLANATAALENINTLVTNLAPLVERAGHTLDHLDTMTRKDGVRLLKDLDAAVKEANATLVQTREAMAGVEDLAQPTSATGHQLRSTLTELQSAARAVNELASALEAQPNAVFFGRQEALSE